MTWPFMGNLPPAQLPAFWPRRSVLCATCKSAEAPRPLITPLCDSCNDRLAGYGPAVTEPRPSA